ncbi:MAG: glycosyltransferase [bacterium]|jgi:glycosyltransferase involved in cell wall biosynthesis
MNSKTSVNYSDLPVSQDKAEFSICIPVYNGMNSLPDTLRSIRNLDYPGYEIVVVDDASKDQTADMAEQAGARVIRLSTNSGPATARNRAAQEASGEILLFTDSDVLIPKSALAQIRQVLFQTGADAIQGTFSLVCPYSNYFSQYKNLYNRFVLNQLPDWIDTTFTSITAVKREAFLQCGGFDQNIKGASVEDRTLGRNLIDSGYKIYLDRSLEVIHNKYLSGWGFMKNQYKRSRDLIKLLLRNRLKKKQSTMESSVQNQDTSVQNQKQMRFGTNALSTMLRIPLIYLILLLVVFALISPILWGVVLLLGIIYLYLISAFELYLLRIKGPGFALRGIPVNMLDAFISGLGILAGIAEFKLLGKPY